MARAKGETDRPGTYVQHNVRVPVVESPVLLFGPIYNFELLDSPDLDTDFHSCSLPGWFFVPGMFTHGLL